MPAEETEEKEDLSENKKVKTSLEIEFEKNVADANGSKRPGFDEKLVTRDEDCFECKQIYRDPKRSDLIMYLHALSYKVYIFSMFDL